MTGELLILLICLGVSVASLAFVIACFVRVNRIWRDW